MPEPIVAKVTLTALQPLIVGGRGTYSEDVRSSVGEYNRQRKAVIPATSFKGALRFFAETWKDFLFPNLDVDYIFGKGGNGSENASQVIFTDLISTQSERYVFIRRNRVKLDPNTKSIEPRSLLMMDVVKPKTIFEGKLIFLDKEVFNVFMEKFNGREFYIGRMKTAGYGKVKLEIEYEESRTEKIKKGLNYILLKPLTPFISSIYGKEGGKSYIIQSKNYLSGSALKAAAKIYWNADLKFASHLYPHNPLNETSERVPTVLNPMTLYKRKHSKDDYYLYNLTDEILLRRLNKICFTMKIDGYRVEPAKGFFEMESDYVKSVKNVKRIFSSHITMDRETATGKIDVEKSKGINFIMQSYTSDIMFATVLSEEDFDVFKYIVVGAGRGRGYGVMELAAIHHIEENEYRERIKKKIIEFNDKIKQGTTVVPLLLRTHFIGDPVEVFGAEKIVDSIVDVDEFRYYVPEPGKENGKSVILKAISPGSVLFLGYPSVDEAVNRITKVRFYGEQKYSEHGFGDFLIL